MKQLDTLIVELRGQPGLAEQIAEQYLPFIRAVVRETVSDPAFSESEGYSCGLQAFFRAIETYEAGRSAFLTYARTVIRHAVMDAWRRERRERHSSFEDAFPGGVEAIAEPEDAIGNAIEVSERRRETDAFRRQLMVWGIRLEDLPESSPGWVLTRQTCRKVVSLICEKPELLHHVRQYGQLPLNEIEKLSGMSRKRFERHRPWILAHVLLNTGDFESLREILNLT